AQALPFATEANNLNDDSSDLGYPAVLANASLHMERLDEFRYATGLLESRFPNVAFTHFCMAVRAANDEHWIEAENEIKKAQKLGLSSDIVESFLNSGVHAQALMWRLGYAGVILVGLWIAGLFVLFVIGKMLSNATIKSIDSSDPNSTLPGAEITLRRWYR